jgi:DNA repair protein RadD
MQKLTPRWYQQEAVTAAYKYIEANPGKNPCIVIPTAGGKTAVLSMFCADVVTKWNGRVLILAHVKELLQQSADELAGFLPPGMVGSYGNSLGSRDTTHPVICGQIQSVFKRAGELGRFDLIIIDEAHLLSPNEGTRYQTFIQCAKVVNPNVRIIGLTATPYRMDCGYICGPDNILNEIAYEVGVKELIVQGYLCPIRTRAGKEHPDLQGVHTRGGEYIESEMAERMDAIVGAACEEVAGLTKGRHTVLVFASGLEHGRHVQAKLAALTGEEVGFVCGDTPSHEREELLTRFKGEAKDLFAKPLKYLVNMNVLTTGFNARNIDAIVLMRATLSPGLYYQMVGRALRVHPSKTDAIVIDYGENTVRHGPIDAIRIEDKTPGGEGEAPAKECPECHAVVFAGVARCPECGFEFPKPEPKYKDKAGNAGVLSGEVTTTEYNVSHVSYFVHHKRNNPDAPTTMRVDYDTGGLYGSRRSEWLCFNHDGWARQKAEQWWRDRSLVLVPATTENAVLLANAGALADTTKIVWREVAGQKFGSIVGYDIEDRKPTPEEVDAELIRQDELDQAERDEWGEETKEPVTVGSSAGNWFDGLADDQIPF